MIPLDRVRELLSLAPGPHGGTLMDTSMVHDLARDVLTLAAALETAERERDTARSAHAAAPDLARALVAAVDALRAAERERDAPEAADGAGECCDALGDLLARALAELNAKGGA